tara:strand:- start:470 stop:796 length:327 start_codon:yes stop_codon:yes gene_type:complete
MKRSKASLKNKLREAGIPIPKNATLDELIHREKHWMSGDGHIMRRFRASRGVRDKANVLDKNTIYWVPNSEFAQNLLKTGIVFSMGRSKEPPADATFLDVPEDYGEEE